MNNHILISALAAGLVGFGAAHAQAQTQAPEDNGDTSKGGQMFERLDADSSGSLSPDELKQMRQVMAKMRFDKADTNSDSHIDHDEFMAQADKRADAMFKRMDADEDGTLSAEESMRAHHPRHGHKGHHGKHHGDDSKSHHDNKADGAKDMKSDMKSDKDRGKRWFDRMDADSNGEISRDEWATAMQKMHDRHDDTQRDDR